MAVSLFLRPRFSLFLSDSRSNRSVRSRRLDRRLDYAMRLSREMQEAILPRDEEISVTDKNSVKRGSVSDTSTYGSLISHLIANMCVVIKR